MTTLHLVNHADALAACLAVAAADDAILLIEDGVYAAADALAPDRPLHALAADLQARGLSRRVGGRVQAVDDAGFVDLVVDHSPVVTWR